MKETTIDYYGIKLTCVGDYQPEEYQVRYFSDGSGYPGNPSEFTIEKVLTESGDDIFGIFYDEQLEQLEEMCLTNIEE